MTSDDRLFIRRMDLEVSELERKLGIEPTKSSTIEDLQERTDIVEARIAAMPPAPDVLLN